MGTERGDQPGSLPNRKHPLRLPKEMYRLPGQVVFVTLCTRRNTSLVEVDTAGKLCEIMGRIGEKRRTRVHTYCIMPDHVHLAVSVAAEGGDLEKWILYFKREAARALRCPGLWQRSYWDRHARPGDSVVSMVAYALNNPVRAGLCARWDEWPFSWSEWHPESRGPDPNA